MAKQVDNDTDDFVQGTLSGVDLPGSKASGGNDGQGGNDGNQGGTQGGAAGTQGGGNQGGQNGGGAGSQGDGTQGNQSGNQGGQGNDNNQGNAGSQGQNNGNDETKAVVIDNVEYNLDDKGNAVNKDGTVFKTAAEVAELTEEEVVETTAIEDFFKLTGVKPVDENGQPKAYEDSIPGLLQAAVDTGELKGQQAFNNLLASQSHFKRYYEYLQRGGDPVQFHKQVASSWKEVKFDKKNTDMLTNAVVAQLMEAGIKEDKAKLTAKTYGDTGQLEEMGSEAYNYLVGKENAREEAEKASYQQRVKDQQATENKYWTEVETTVKAGKLKNVTIPDNEKPAFFKYVAEAVNKSGHSQGDLDEANLTTQEFLELRYLLFKKLDLGKLITGKAGTLRAEGLKKRFATSQQGVGNGAGANNKKFQQSGNNLDTLTTEHVMQ